MMNTYKTKTNKMIKTPNKGKQNDKDINQRQIREHNTYQTKTNKAAFNIEDTLRVYKTKTNKIICEAVQVMVNKYK